MTIRNLHIRDLQYGCYLWNTENTSVEDCLVESCTYGITFNPAAGGCVTASRLVENDYGLVISGRSTSSTVRSNRITNSTRTGIYLYRTRGGLIADNYLENTRNVYVGDQASGVNWTAGPVAGPSVAGGPLLGGNFWGRPSGRGFSQTSTDADRDGISDRTYRVSGYMVDTLPLRERTNRTPPVAGFSASPSSGTAPLTVRFNDTSRGDAGLWDWSFGDGTTSVTRNATHRYAEPGRYTVTLRVRDATGGNASIRTGAITVAAPVKRPTAAFRAAPRTGRSRLRSSSRTCRPGRPERGGGPSGTARARPSETRATSTGRPEVTRSASGSRTRPAARPGRRRAISP